MNVQLVNDRTVNVTAHKKIRHRRNNLKIRRGLNDNDLVSDALHFTLESRRLRRNLFYRIEGSPGLILSSSESVHFRPVLILNLNRMHPPKRRRDNVGNLPGVRLQRLASPTTLRVPKVLERQQYAVDALSIKHRARNMNRLRRFDSRRILRKRDCATKIL